MIEYSHYQKDFFNELKNGFDNIVLDAKAGSGKTTTIIKGAESLPKNSKIGFVCFNKHIREELETKVPKNIKVRTFHQLGVAAIYKNLGNNVPFDNDKVKGIYDVEITKCELNLTYNENRSLGTVVKKLVSLLKSNGVEPSKENIIEIMNHHSFDNGKEMVAINKAFELNEFYKFIKKIYLKSATNLTVYDYDDMVFLPVYHKWDCQKFDYLFVDELQDVNKIQIDLIERSLAEDGRIIGVGDFFQAIYGFRGSDINSIPNFVEKFDAKTMPLSISYRCPKSHIKLAQKIVPDIEQAPNAIEGSIIEIDDNEIVELANKNDLIICRNNAPLIKICLRFIGSDKKVTIRGTDFGKTLNKIIKGFKTNNVNELSVRVSEWLDEKIEQALKTDSSVGFVHDVHDSIQILVELFKDSDVKEIMKYVDKIFSDKDSSIVLSTIHKAKGLEAENVFIVYPFLMPSRYAKKEWERVQELNMKYVAFTRAKKTLYLVDEADADEKFC